MGGKSPYEAVKALEYQKDVGDDDPVIEDVADKSYKQINRDNVSDNISRGSFMINHTQKCYVCKLSYKEIHHFYHRHCPPCAQFNWDKRSITCDLTGKYALVTGGRTKIGYQMVLSLL